MYDDLEDNQNSELQLKEMIMESIKNVACKKPVNKEEIQIENAYKDKKLIHTDDDLIGKIIDFSLNIEEIHKDEEPQPSGRRHLRIFSAGSKSQT